MSQGMCPCVWVHVHACERIIECCFFVVLELEAMMPLDFYLSAEQSIVWRSRSKKLLTFNARVMCRVDLRPHVKTHKCHEIARMQVGGDKSNGIIASTIPEVRYMPANMHTIYARTHKHDFTAKTASIL